MTGTNRTLAASRAFAVTVAFALALLARTPPALLGAAAVAVMVGVITLAGQSAIGPSARVVALAEGLLAAVVVAITLPSGVALLPYLAAPALVAGVTAGLPALLPVVAVEAVTLAVAANAEAMGTVVLLEVAAPWLFTSLGVGLLGAWLREMGRSTSDAESYESARRLLTQLRTVSRQLSSGLDPVGIARHISITAQEAAPGAAACVFVRTDGGLLTPLAEEPGTCAEVGGATEGLLETCWAEMSPVSATGPLGDRASAIPLVSGARMVAVVLVQTPAGTPLDHVGALARRLAEHSPRLDAALIFDEIRSAATVEERQRLAREIHDGVAQEVASLGYLVDDLTARAATEQQRAGLRELRGELTRIVAELRLSIFDLRSQVSPSAGLGSALSDYVQAVGAKSGLTVHLTLDEGPTRLRREVEAELLRIVQEAVTNVRKHAGATNLWVDASIHPPYARVTIRDDGRGLGASRDDSYGLRIMRERADRISADLDILAEPSGESPSGTSIVVTVGEAAVLSRL